MQSNVAIGLFTKLKSLYEKENKFLAFPAVTVGWKARSLSFTNMDISTAPGLAEALMLQGNFAKSTNFIAETATKLSYDDRNLWDEYQTILKNKVLPSKSGTADEKRIQELHDFLSLPTIAREDGSMISREQNHDLYQSEWYNAITNYNERKTSIGDSSDPKEQEQWKVEEVMLKAKLEKAENDWISKGLRIQVSAAISEIKAIGTRNPVLAWDEYQDKFDKHLITVAEANGAVEFPYYLTSFYPADFYMPSSTAWQKFTLNKDELKRLVATAPDDLKALKSDVEIESLSAEIAYVAISREWLNMNIFTARNWKFSDGEEVLSDGGNPAQGKIPAVPVGILFAKNVKGQVASNGSNGQPKILKTMINPAVLANLQKVKLTTATSIPIVNTHTVKIRPQIAVPVATVKKTPTVIVRDRRTVVTRETIAAKPVNLNRVQLTTSKVNQQFIVKPGIVNKLTLFKKANLNKDVSAAAPVVPQPEAEFEVVAFVCQRLPVCPNADPGLFA